MKLNDLIEEVIGERPKFFRAPHGANTDFSKQLALEEGMVVMNWTYGFDYFPQYMDAEKLKEAMITGKGPEVEGKLLFIETGRKSVDARSGVDQRSDCRYRKRFAGPRL